MEKGSASGPDVVARLAKLERIVIGEGGSGLLERMKRTEAMILLLVVLVAGKAVAAWTGLPEPAGVGAAGVAGGVFRLVVGLLGKAAGAASGEGGGA